MLAKCKSEMSYKSLGTVRSEKFTAADPANTVKSPQMDNFKICTHRKG